MDKSIKFGKLTKIVDDIKIDDDIYTKSNLNNFVKAKSNFIFVAKNNVEVVAFLYGYIMNRPDGKKMGYIHSVDVKESYQKQGIGTNLIDFVLNSIKNDVYKCFVLADTDNYGAVKLYKKFFNKKEQNLYEKIFEINKGK